MSQLIGLPVATNVSPVNGLTYYAPYANIVRSIVAAGGVPILIPVDMPDEHTRALYTQCQGVLVPGGGDIDPKYFNEAPHPATQTPDLARDHTEINLIRWAVEDDKPLFGICRGHQVINVALGGSLIQDIPSQVQTEIVHNQQNVPAGRVARVHDVQVHPETHLARILQGTHFTVNSLHHQAINQPAPNVVLTAFSPDEVIEGLEIPGKRFALSVQWHPEDLAADDPAMRRLFEAFIAACNGA
jgi:putative glutamine amidotransferase